MRSTQFRTVNRRVEFDIELIGEPFSWTNWREGSRPVQPEWVRLTFNHGDDGYSVDAAIRGPHLSKTTGKPLKAAPEMHYPGPPDLWPDWLAAIADRHRPESYAEHRGPLSPDSRS